MSTDILLPPDFGRREARFYGIRFRCVMCGQAIRYRQSSVEGADVCARCAPRFLASAERIRRDEKGLP